MKKLLITLAGIFVGLIALLVIAVVLAPRLVDWNDYKPQIVAAVKKQTGRDLVIGGDIQLNIVPRVAFAFHDVKLSNGEGFRDAHMVTVESVRGSFALFPLILRKVRLDELIVTRPIVNLEVDRSGHANWILGAPSPAKPAPAKGSREAEGLPFSDLTLGDVRIIDGGVTYRDARTGQQVLAKAINVKAALANLDSANVKAALANLDSALSVNGDLTINEQPVTLKLALNSPRGLNVGRRATLNSALQSRNIQAAFDGGVRQKPIAALDGVFDLSIPSVAALANWLQRPLAKGQPDPGGVKARAVFEGEGPRMVLKEATIEAAAARARATGMLDVSGKTRRVKFDLQAGMIDLDRYLPPPTKTPIVKARPRSKGQVAPRDFLAALPDRAFDLSPLRQTTGEISIKVDGIKATGYAVGPIKFDAKIGDGRLAANLNELRLYGGNVTGSLKLEGAQAVLGLDTVLDIEKVNVGTLARVAQGADAKVAGILSGSLRASAKGKSPRALVEELIARANLKLGGINVKDAPGTLSKLDLTIDVPGMKQGPTLRGDTVYNAESVALSLNLAPLPRVLSGKPFATKLSVDSRRLQLRYDGALQFEPVAGLDGRLSLDVPSVAKLLAWGGTPLPKGQPDPGPLKAVAVLATDGAKAELKEASIEGKALKVKAAGKIDASKPVKRFDATVDLIEADLNAYLPERKQQKQKGGKPSPATTTPGGWSDAPIDLSILRRAEGKATIKIGRVHYGDIRVEAGTASANLAKSALKTAVDKVKLSNGTADMTATIDASKATPVIDYQATLSGVEARRILQTFADTDRLSGKLDFQTAGRTAGSSQKQMIAALNGQGRFMFKDGAIHGINIPAALRKAKTLGFSESRTEKTDFAELSGSFTIKNGVLENPDLKLLAPLARVTGAGRVPMPPRTIDYRAEAKLVATLKGQGGKDALAGLPIPVSIKGSWDKPSIRVDWNGVLTAVAKDPQRLANLPGEFRNLGKDLGVKLPILDKARTADEILKLVPGVLGAKKPQQPPSETKEPAEKQKPNPLKTLRNLLGK